MSTFSSIEWTETTWNPVTGCTKISQGCKNCYAERLANRLRSMGVASYKNGFQLTMHDRLLDAPYKWKKPRTVFVNSMSDLFHENVPDEFIGRVFEVMRKCRRHQFQVLTKRSKRLERMSPEIEWTDNVWMGVSVENSECAYRITHLQNTGAKVKFLSLEPLLGSLPNLKLKGIDWVIVGGESGPGARVMDPRWVTQIRDRCMKRQVPFFFKQWGGVRKHSTGRTLDGRTWDEMPKTAARDNHP